MNGQVQIGVNDLYRIIGEKEVLINALNQRIIELEQRIKDMTDETEDEQKKPS